MIRQLTLLAVVLPTALAQTSVTIPCDRDNTLYESATGHLSAGAGPRFFVGRTDQSSNSRRRALLRFDLASIPTNALILSASLTLEVDMFNSPITVSAHRVLTNWGEGTSVPAGAGGGGAPATPGDATWLHAISPGSTWTTPGGDFAAGASFTHPIVQPGSTVTGTQAPVADVQNWVRNPGQNFGWLLKTDEQAAQTAIRCHSREATTQQPTLIISYLAPGQTTQWGLGCAVGTNTFQHSWSAPPIGGTTPQLLQMDGPPNALAANLLALNFDRTGFPLLPGCNLYLPITGLIVNHSIITLDANGAGATNLAIPPGFPGVLFASQTAALDNSPSGYVLSNAALSVLQ
ncbi:MAG: DNRLRE domain-containing protein [bacterium]|nr:DNRLRE domain-containing protein [bacterium]